MKRSIFCNIAPFLLRKSLKSLKVHRVLPFPSMGKKSRPPSPDLEQPYPPPPHHAYPYPPPYGPPQPMYMPPPPNDTWTPWLVPLIFFVDVVLFVYSMYINNCPANHSRDKCVLADTLGRFAFEPTAENILLGPSIATLQKVGGIDRELVLKGEGWRLVTSMWYHAGVIHLLINMVSLLIIGVRIEQDFGFFKVGFLYVGSGFGGAILSALSDRKSVSVGASGALFGLLGGLLSELFMNWTIYANKCAVLCNFVLIIAINIIIGLLPMVDSSAHIGGFVSGFFLGWVLLMKPRYGYISSKYLPPGAKKKSKYMCYQYFFWAVGAVALILGYGISLSALFTGQKMNSKFLEINLKPSTFEVPEHQTNH